MTRRRWSAPEASPTVRLGHECQRQAPARWPATLQPRWGAPGEDLATRLPARGKRGRHSSPAPTTSVRSVASDATARPTRHAPKGEDPMSDTTPSWSFETKQIHAGQAPDPPPAPAPLPIYQTTSLRVQRHRARGEPVRAQGVRQHLHPHHEPDPGRRRAAHRRLEGGVGALLVASGQAAETLAILNIAEAGDHIVAARSLYGGTYNLLQVHAAEARHRDDVRRGPGRPRRVAGARSARTPRLFFAETIAQPEAATSSTSRASPASRTRPACRSSSTTPSRRRTSSARSSGAPTSSCTRRRSTSAATAPSIGGVIVDGGTFDFAADAEQFPGLNEPDPSYHGLVYAPRPRRRQPARRQPRLHPQGAGAAAARPRPGRSRRSTRSSSPRASRRCRLRIERHVENAAEGRRVPRGPRRGRVGRLRRPARRARGTRWRRSTRPRGAGAVLAFEIKGGLEAGQAVRRGADAAQPRRQHRRRALARHPPGLDDALAS